MNIFNEATTTSGITLRTQNFQDASVVSNSVPVLGIGEAVSVQPISSYGISLLNTDAPSLRASLLTGVEEAVVYEANNTNEILFYTNLGGLAPTADKLRLKIADADIHAEVPFIVGGSLKLENGNAGVLSTIAGNKDIEIASHGTGAVVLRQGATEVINATPTTITTPMLDIKTLGSGASALNGILGKAGKHLYIVSPDGKDLRLCVNGSVGDEDGELIMNVGISKISVYKTLGVSGSGIDIGSSVAPFTNVYGTNVYGITKMVSDKLRSTDLSPTDAIYQEIAFGLSPPAGGGAGVNEMNFLFDKTDEVSPPIGSSNAGTSVLRLTPSEADLNVPMNGLTIKDGLPLKSSLIRHFAPASTTQTTIKMGSNKIQFYTGGLVATQTDGQEAISIEDGAVGNGKINFKRDCEFSNDITLTTSINMATELKAFNSIHTANTKTLSVASYGTDASLGLTATGTGVIQANSDMSFSNGKKLTCRADTGDKIVLQNATKIHTSPGQLHHYTPDLQTLIWAEGTPMLQLKNAGSSMSSKFVVGTNNPSFGKMAVKTAGGAVFNALGGWDNNYMVVGEVDTAGGVGLGLGLGTNTTSNYCVIMATSPTNSWRDLHITASSIEFNHNGTNRMYIRGNIVVATNILPSSSGVYNIGSDSNPGGGSGSATAQWFNNSFFNNVYAGNVLITSDRSMKEDIVDLPIGLDYIRKLRPKQYKYKGSKGRKHYGLIAQEVRELNGDDMISSWGLRPCGLQQLNYNEFIAPIIKAIQELDMKISNSGGSISTPSRPYHYANDTTLIDEARLDILEERVAEVEKLETRLAVLEKHEDSIVDSEGTPDMIEVAMSSIHALEQRVLKLERANKKLTTAVNKLLKQTTASTLSV